MMNPNLEAVAKANDMCNRLGMDTMTCGSTIAWAMDCFDRGMLKPEDYDGIKLEWGVMEPVIDLVEKIAMKEGKLGELLAKGSAKAAAEVGNGSEALLTTSKGLESPMHDPRCNWGDGLAYATSVRGACHVSNLMFLLEWGALEFPEIGVDHILDPMGTEYKADGAAKMHDIGCITNSACWCQFPSQALSLPQWVEAFNLVTGWGWDIDVFMKTGARIWYLQRCLGHIGSRACLPQPVARLNPARFEGLTKRQRDGGGRCVAITVDIDHHLVLVDAQPSNCQVDDALVCLVGNDEVDVVDAQAGVSHYIEHHIGHDPRGESEHAGHEVPRQQRDRDVHGDIGQWQDRDLGQRGDERGRRGEVPG